MNDVFKFEQQEEGERELVLLVGPRGPLPHQRYATHSDIKAALAEKELCVVPKGRHDWVFAEEVMKRDEEIARLTARVVELEASRERILERTSTDILDLDEAAEDRAERIAELEAQLATEKAAVADYARLWEELTNKVSELTAEQQRRQEVERERDRYRDKKRDAEQREASLADDVDQLRAELASCRKVVGAALRLRAKMARDDEGRPLIDNFAGSDFDDLDGACAIYEIGLTHEPERNAAERAALASAGNDSGEALGPDGESPPEVSGRCRVCQGRGRELRCRRVETCTACDGTGRQTIGEVGAGSVGAAVGNEAGTEGADPSGLLRSAQPAPSKPANPGELSANPQSPNHPGIPESSNPSKSSNGSTDPSATVPRSEVEALLRRVAAIPCRCYLAPCLSCAAKSLLAKAEVKP